VRTYRPGDSLAHRMDPRSKLAAQAAFALAAFVHTTPRGLLALTGVAALALAAARLSPLASLADLRVLAPFLVALPLLEGLTLGPPWFSLAAARGPALASYRTLLVVLVSVAYVRSTPVRESRAAVQWLVPGRPGRVLGVGVALAFRNLAVLRADLTRSRRALRARLGDRRPVRERMQLLATAGLSRALGRTDALSRALRARCFAWNPTLPALAATRADLPALAAAAGLLAWTAL